MDKSRKELLEETIVFSIVVPCYNCESTIIRCVDSLINQTYRNIEVVIVDDGSTDCTSELCEQFNDDSRVIVVRQENQGVTAAWKKGVITASGEYVLSCDSDDYYNLDTVTKLYEYICDKQPDIVAYSACGEYQNGNIVYFRNILESGYYTKEDIDTIVLPNFFYNNGFQSEILLKSRWSKCFSRSLLIRIMDDIPNDITFGEDALTVFAAVYHAQNLLCINEFSPYHYIRNEYSLTGTHNNKVFDKLSMLYKQFFLLADKYNYKNTDQIYEDYSAMLYVHIKKALDSDGVSRKQNISKVREVINSADFNECMKHNNINNYPLKSRVFAFFIRKKWIGIANGLLRLLGTKDTLLGRK